MSESIRNLLSKEMEEESLYEYPSIKPGGRGLSTLAPSEIQGKSVLDAPAVKIGGVVVALAATWITFRDAISRAFFKSMNKGDGGAFADLQNKRDNAINEITAPARKGVLVPDAMDKVNAVVKEYDRAYFKRRNMLGIGSVFDEMKALKRHQWMEVMFATGAVASVAVGAILAIASGRDAVIKKEQIERDAGSNPPQR